MGVDMYWKDKYEFFDYMVKGPETLPAELSCASFEDFRERISVTGVEMATVKNAPKYETGFMRKTSDFRPGFNTMYRGNKMGTVYRFPGAKTPDGKEIPPHPQSDNGKMELWSEDLLLYGNGALPMYIEPPITKLSRPDLLDEYPYTLITGGRSHAFFHTEYRNSPWMREVHMFPTMDINPATAAEHGIEQDDWVYIETYVDRIKQRANLTEAIKPGMIHVEHDWWFPEREATDDLHGAIATIKKAGVKAGVSIKPKTPVSAIVPYLNELDLVLIMSVEPGFGGQAFIPASLEKIAQLRALADELGTETIIEVDGGISSHNAHEVFGAGADVLVAGSSVFGAEDPQAEVVKMLNA